MSKSTVMMIADGVWCVQSGIPGRHLGFVGGTHGNEAAGIAAVSELLTYFASGRLTLTRGTLTLAHGNPEAIAMNARATAPERDLNRCFAANVLTTPGDTPEAKRAHVLAKALMNVEIGIDLHATNLPSTPFVVMQAITNPEAYAVLSHLSPRILLTDPHWIFAGAPNTLDEYFNREPARVGICYETGFAGDIDCVRNLVVELIDVLNHFGLVSFGEPLETYRPKEHYELIAAIRPQTEHFTFANEDTLANFRSISAEDVLGYDGETPIYASHTGILVFPKAKHLRFVGKPVGYLARRV